MEIIFHKAPYPGTVCNFVFSSPHYTATDRCNIYQHRGKIFRYDKKLAYVSLCELENIYFKKNVLWSFIISLIIIFCIGKWKCSHFIEKDHTLGICFISDAEGKLFILYFSLSLEHVEFSASTLSERELSCLAYFLSHDTQKYNKTFKVRERPLLLW